MWVRRRFVCKPLFERPVCNRSSDLPNPTSGERAGQQELLWVDQNASISVMADGRRAMWLPAGAGREGKPSRRVGGCST